MKMKEAKAERMKLRAQEKKASKLASGSGGSQGEARARGGQAEPARRPGRGQGGTPEADRAPAVLLLRVLAQAAADVQLKNLRGSGGA
uniref:Uncharacterized protein n=1 Tax=Arundo donax TaxID=35708 RepID=A0A0A9BRH9_ARUDO